MNGNILLYDDNSITELCRKYTTLNEEEIVIIKNSAKSLCAMANIFGADAFIDCPMKDGLGDSIVVAQARPQNLVSLYQNSVIGLVATKENEPAVTRSIDLAITTRFMKAITQEGCNAVQTVEPIMANNKVIGVFILEQRMEAFETNDLMPSSNDKNKVPVTIENDLELTEVLEEGVLFLNKDLKIIYHNNAVEQIYKRLGFVTKIDSLNYGDIALTLLPQNMEKGETRAKEIRFGNNYFNVRTIYVNRKDFEYIVSISDITQRKLQEKALVLKSAAFKEMHHRVKNNLQTIAALLRLQRNHAKSDIIKSELNNTISRILAIASTHELLLDTEMEEVSLNDIIASVSQSVLSCFKSPALDLKFEYFGGDFDIKFDKANAIALIVNELAQNSVKHAFKNQDSGTIVLTARKKALSDIEIVFTDDGSGFDFEKMKNENHFGMGWNIIQLMVNERLKGHINVSSDKHGTRVEILF